MEHRLVLGSTHEDNDLVFPDEFGAPLNPMALTRALQRAARQAEAGHVKLHDLRHFHASLLLQSGQSPVLVSKRLGHSSVSMTLDVYGHLMPGWQREAAEVFAKAMSNGS
jgi:integrase